MHTPIEKVRRVIEDLFKFIEKDIEVFLPLEGNNQFILLNTVCAKCGERWYPDEKECFHCKQWYPHAVRCSNCKKIIAEENIHNCPFCHNKKSQKACISCGNSDLNNFVPITFCTKCGNRENKFEFKIIKF